MDIKAHKVCAKCKRIIGELTLPEALAPLGVVYEKPHFCPVCEIKNKGIENA